MRIFKKVFTTLGKLFPFPKTLPPVCNKESKPNEFGCILGFEARKKRNIVLEQQINERK